MTRRCKHRKGTELEEVENVDALPLKSFSVHVGFDRAVFCDTEDGGYSSVHGMKEGLWRRSIFGATLGNF